MLNLNGLKPPMVCDVHSEYGEGKPSRAVVVLPTFTPLGKTTNAIMINWPEQWKNDRLWSCFPSHLRSSENSCTTPPQKKTNIEGPKKRPIGSSAPGEQSQRSQVFSRRRSSSTPGGDGSGAPNREVNRR